MEATRKNSTSDPVANLQPMVDRVAAGAHEYVDKAATAAAAAAKAMGEKGEELGVMQERYLDLCRDRVRENPIAAVGVAIAAGFLLSILLPRR
jgi:ElaB/YqjD/DUF883 family membrane-anchored ribosome-binding protein